MNLFFLHFPYRFGYYPTQIAGNNLKPSFFASDPMEQGKVKWFDVKKGYGFIVQPNGRDLFVHKSGLDKGCRLEEGMPVEYEISEGVKGPCATTVHPL